MDTEPEERPDGANDVTQLVDALRFFAERAVHGQSFLGLSDAEDIAHQAFLELWEKHGQVPPKPILEWARPAIDRVVDRLQKRRKRNAERIRQGEAEARAKRRGRRGKALESTVDPPTPPTRQVGVPTLYRHLVALGKGSRFETEIAKLAVEAAGAVVADPRVFSANEIALFALAWRHGSSAAQIVGAAGTKTPRAVTERLKRIAKKVEDVLAGYLGAVLPPDSRDRLAVMLAGEPTAGEDKKPTTHYDAQVYEDVMNALRALIHKDLRQVVSISQ